MSDQTPKVQFDLPWPVEQVDASLTVTSKIYPVEAIDEMAVAWGVDRLRFMPADTGEVDVEFNVESLELRPQLQEHLIEEEGIDVDFSVESLEFKTALLSHEVEPEGLDVGFDVDSLTLKAALVSHDQPAEAMDVNWAVISLELSS